MKRITLQVILGVVFLHFAFELSGQCIEVSQPEINGPVIIGYFDGERMQKRVVSDYKTNPMARLDIKGKIVNLDLTVFRDGYENRVSNPSREAIQWLEPGAPVEGDLHSDIAYTRDGTMFAVIYQNSDNMTFYDAETCEPVATVQLVRQPVDLYMGEQNAYVACHEGRSVVAVSLEDFSIVNYIPVDGYPCQVEVSPAEDTAFIACDSYRDGWMIAVDMANNNEVLYLTHDPYFHHYGWGGAMGRTLYKFSKFHLSPKGGQFICGDTSTYQPTIFNTSNGHPVKTFWIGGWRGAGYSPTGDTIYIYSNNEDTVKMLRVNANDFTVIDAIYSDIGCMIGFVSYSDLAISHDGNEVLVSDRANDRYCRFDFDDYTCQVITPWILNEDAHIFSSSDGQYAVVANYLKVQIVNLETGALNDNWPSSMRVGSPLCVSPFENTLVVGNSPGMGIEKLWVVDFSNVNTLIQEASITCGEPPEADMPHVAAVSENGQKAFSVNYLTRDISIIDIYNNTLDTLIYCEDISGLKLIPRTDYALIYGEQKVFSHIVSQLDFSEVAEIQAGGIRDALVSSDGQTAYLLEYQVYDWMRITKVRIDGPGSFIEKQIMSLGCDCGISFTNDEVDIETRPALSPDDKMLLIGDDNDTLGPVVNIIDTETLEILCQVPVLDECVYDFAFTDDSRRVAVVNFYNSLIPIIYLDGENSFVESYIPIATRSYGAAYNKMDGLFYVLDQTNYIFKADPLTGEVVGQMNTFDDTNWDIEIDLRGNPLVLTNYSMIYSGEAYAMPGYTSILSYDAEHDLFISPVPGPDKVCIFDPALVGIKTLNPADQTCIKIFPNPSADGFILESDDKILQVEIFTLKGDMVFRKEFDDKTAVIPSKSLKPGIYLFRITTESGIFSRKAIVN
ncbi:MAG: T9SS type A sorting domain-containing protein [Bacteroidales bacterium]|nr:T9SS type A sorting domain-containing protein [Bacteroidales bacterium]